ncbi:hypothetical protein [Streptomyces actuosus]|uniref:hypothetical protein n=1 Tax=Streptomyces actuosus TaxID=1885 RepID=UPI001F056E5E|nr:hypothetical protein [Streptomyces actuosus]
MPCSSTSRPRQHDQPAQAGAIRANAGALGASARAGPGRSPPPWTCWSSWAPTFFYFTEEGGPARSAELDELATDSGLRDTGAEPVQQFMARLNVATRAREGEPLELRGDMGKTHVFDPLAGTNLSHPENDR